MESMLFYDYMLCFDRSLNILFSYFIGKAGQVGGGLAGGKSQTSQLLSFLFPSEYACATKVSTSVLRGADIHFGRAISTLICGINVLCIIL